VRDSRGLAEPATVIPEVEVHLSGKHSQDNLIDRSACLVIPEPLIGGEAERLWQQRLRAAVALPYRV
jgi:hypothetical protein